MSQPRAIFMIRRMPQMLLFPALKTSPPKAHKDGPQLIHHILIVSLSRRSPAGFA
jgi:hypothetical protein